MIVAGFQAPLSFLNAYDFRRDILAALKSSPQKARLLVLEATGIVEIDFTAAQVLTDIIRQCHADGVDFAIARLESIRAQAAMVRFGIAALLGPDRQFHSVEEAIGARQESCDPSGPEHHGAEFMTLRPERSPCRSATARCRRASDAPRQRECR